ncbi:MAG: triose-phosphate isomerase [Pseudomonadota bacterium]|nr:triose-phosphate isomerase [Pseudomonadota bacterium]
MRPLIVGNWKMNLLSADAATLALGITNKLKELGNPGCEIVICPAFVALRTVGEVIADSQVSLGAQDCHTEEFGAYTGEVSASMLFDLNCKFVIVGHSERRVYQKETDDLVSKKVLIAQDCGLRPIICVGETFDQRNNGQTLKVIEKQIIASIPDEIHSNSIIIAYEPVWAIGSGEIPALDQILEVHKFIHGLLSSKVPNGSFIQILYGGSMNPQNCSEILSLDYVNGGLIGGASLTVDNFWSICTSCVK